MMIIGCDFHPRYQQIAMMDTATGELVERRLEHEMRWLLVEAAQTAVRFDPELLRLYQRLKFRRGAGVAKVAVARKLAVKLYWMLRATASCAQMAPMQGSPRGTLVPHVGSTY